MKSNLIEIITTSTCNEDFKNKSWKVFFENKNRGLTFEEHFPKSRMDKAIYILAINDNQIVGGCCILKCLKDNSAGILSLVFVQEEFRGKGIFNKIMKKALNVYPKVYKKLILWASTPNLYERFGFVKAEKSFALEVVRDNRLESVFDLQICNVQISRDYPIPSYALELYKLTYKNAFCYATKNINDAYSLSSFNGEPIEILDLIKSFQSKKIVCNFTCDEEKILNEVMKLRYDTNYIIKLEEKSLLFWHSMSKCNIKTYHLLDMI